LTVTVKVSVSTPNVAFAWYLASTSGTYVNAPVVAFTDTRPRAGPVASLNVKVSRSASSAVTVPVTAPIASVGFATVARPLVGATSTWPYGATGSLTATVVVPPCPSSTVKVTLSVLLAVVAVVADAAWRAVAVGV